MKEQILTLLREVPGLTDRELADRIVGPGARQQSVNQAANALAAAGKIARCKRSDRKLGNYPEGEVPLDTKPLLAVSDQSHPSMLQEDDMKQKLQSWLEGGGWRVQVMWGRDRGIDIEAQRERRRWIIEVKGCGSRDAMRANYFQAILGELLQRMNDPDAHYSIALPDLKQFRGLWRRLPPIAKTRTGITALFVAPSGEVTEERD